MSNSSSQFHYFIKDSAIHRICFFPESLVKSNNWYFSLVKFEVPLNNRRCIDLTEKFGRFFRLAGGLNFLGEQHVLKGGWRKEAAALLYPSVHPDPGKGVQGGYVGEEGGREEDLYYIVCSWEGHWCKNVKWIWKMKVVWPWYRNKVLKSQSRGTPVPRLSSLASSATPSGHVSVSKLNH